MTLTVGQEIGLPNSSSIGKRGNTVLLRVGVLIDLVVPFSALVCQFGCWQCGRPVAPAFLAARAAHVLVFV